MNKWEKIKIVQMIGTEVCEDCGPDRDCGLEIENCSRISSAIEALNGWLEEDYKP